MDHFTIKMAFLGAAFVVLAILFVILNTRPSGGGTAGSPWESCDGGSGGGDV